MPRFIGAAFPVETGRAAQWVPGLSSLRSVARDDGGEVADASSTLAMCRSRQCR